MNFGRTILVALISVAATISFSQTADIVFVNANIRTINKSLPNAEAVAVRNGKIIAVGSNTAVRKFATGTVNVLDVKGKLLLPGFIDNHTHFMSGGFQLHNVDLRDAKNEKEFAERIREHAKKNPTLWTTGGDWDHDNWPGGNLPAKELIDAFTPSTPVFVNRYDGHMALANSYVLKLAGITKDTPDPPGGTIVRDPVTREATGVLKDEAMSSVYALIPDASEGEMTAAVKDALAEARKYGLTGIQDMSSWADLRCYEKLRANGELTARMYCRLPIGVVDEVIAKGIKAHSGDEMIRLGSMKAFADGSLGSSTALFFEPFDSDPTTRGLASDIVIDGRLNRWATAADKAGLQMSIHAIGDSANSLMLDLFERIIKANPPWDRRFRIEHAQHIAPKDFERFAKLGVIASVQPYHAIDDGRWAEGRIGHKRCATTYAFRTFLDHRVKMCFGSDWTVAPLNPLLGIYAAVTRRTTDENNPGGWFPEQKISVQEAVEAYTINNAFAAYEENEKGTIEEGKLADFVILSDDIFTIAPETIRNVQVEMTVLGGKIVYKKL
ncbi:MAG: amidohydrolase [bacterium]